MPGRVIINQAAFPNKKPELHYKAIFMPKKISKNGRNSGFFRRKPETRCK
jgi:hypothetical protein